MSKHKENQKQQTPNTEEKDREDLKQGAGAADVSSLKKEIEADGQTPNQQKKKAS